MLINNLSRIRFKAQSCLSSEFSNHCFTNLTLCLADKWNESGFRPLLCTYRLNWARRTSWDEWDETALQTQDSKFKPWRSEAEHVTCRSPRLPTILSFTSGWGRNIFVSFKPPRPGNKPRSLAWKAAVLTTTLGPPPVSLTTTTAWPRWKLFTSVKFKGKIIFSFVNRKSFSPSII